MLARRPPLIVRAFQSLQKEGIHTFREKLFAGLRGKLFDLAKFVYSTREVTEIELNLEKFEPRFLQRSDMTVDLVSEAQLARRREEISPDWAGLLGDFQKKGYPSFWILSEERVVGIVCFAVGNYCVKDMGLTLQLKKEEILLYGIFVEVAHRGKITSGILMEKSLLHLKEEGYLRVLAHIDLKNKPSLRYAKNNRYVEIKRWQVRKRFGTVRPVEIKAVGDALDVPRLRRVLEG